MNYRLLVGFLLVTISATAQVQHNFKMDPQETDCHLLPEQFESVTAAYTKLKATTFRLVEEMTISRYKDPAAAAYLSCDGKSGYLMISMQDGSHEIFKNVNKPDWNTFTETRDPVYDYQELKKKLEPVTIQ